MKTKYRIKKNEEFQKIISKKNVKVNKTYIIYYLPKKEEYSRVGISVSKKLGKAHDRNLYKRRLRMIIDESIDFENFDYDLIIILKRTFTTSSYIENKISLENILKTFKINIIQ